MTNLNLCQDVANNIERKEIAVHKILYPIVSKLQKWVVTVLLLTSTPQHQAFLTGWDKAIWTMLYFTFKLATTTKLYYFKCLHGDIYIFMYAKYKNYEEKQFWNFTPYLLLLARWSIQEQQQPQCANRRTFSLETFLMFLCSEILKYL